MKNNETIAAIITVDGAWLDTEKRKLTLPPQVATNVFSQIPPGENFQWVD